MRDAEMVEAVRRGDAHAWAEVFDRYGPRLLAFCTRLLNEPHTAADAVQDTFVVAAQRFDQLRDPSKLRAWLYAIARNECIRHGRSRARLVPVEEPSTMSTPDHLDPAERAAATDIAELLWAAADGLDDNDRILLELNVRHGLEGRELAEAAGISPGQVSMVTKRMRDRIERSLGALLVARRGSRDCRGLTAVLADWDGTFTVLMRKRVARHIDGCDQCDRRRTTLLAPLGSLAAMPFLAAPGDLRTRVTAAVRSVQDGTAPPLPATSEVWPDGFPPLLDVDGHRRRAGWVLAGALLVLFALGASMVAAGGDDEVARDSASRSSRASWSGRSSPGGGSAGAAGGGPEATEPTGPTGSTTIPDASGDHGPGTPAAPAPDDPAPTVPVSPPPTAPPAPPPTLPVPDDVAPPPADGDPPPADAGADQQPAPLGQPSVQFVPQPIGPLVPPLPPVVPPGAPEPPVGGPQAPPADPAPPVTAGKVVTVGPITVPPPGGTVNPEGPDPTGRKDSPPTIGPTNLTPAGPLTTSCDPSLAIASVSVPAFDQEGIESVVLHWTSTDGSAGSTVMYLSGPLWQAGIGPFQSPAEVTYWATVRDTVGAVRSSAQEQLTVTPCPG